jgi:hypothetical protein
MVHWKDAEGNTDWEGYAGEATELAEAEAERRCEVLGVAVKNGQAVGVAVRWATEDLGNGRSIDRSFGGCATCDGGGCGDCRDE